MAAADKWEKIIQSGVGNVSRAIRAKQIAEVEARRHPQPEKPEKPVRKRRGRPPRVAVEATEDEEG